MFSWTKKTKDDKTELEMDTSINDKNNEEGNIDNYIPSDIENSTVVKIESDFGDSRALREGECEDNGYSIEDNWEDEYHIYKGGGLQWYTNFTNRARKKRKIRPNSEDNFVFNTLTIQAANITADTPEIAIIGVEDDDLEVSDKLTFASRYNDNKNTFSKTWKRWVYDFIGSGPTIAMVTWDNDWIGGKGPERWVGDVRVERIDKWDMYFDGAITDLEERLQDCSYIIRRPRKKLKYIRDNWDLGKYVSEGENEDNMIDEGSNTNQAYVIEYWHRGFPWFIPDKKKLEEKAMEYEEAGEPFKAQDYRDSSKGNLEGIHVAYVSDGILLEYRPYEYEHGQYPFVFTTRYSDDKNPFGFGEIRNIKIPQIMHNKADEIEIEAMTRQGLGGKEYQKGAINPKQMDNILENGSKPNMYFEVDNVSLLKDRQGVQVPSSITNYKEHKQRMIETISSNVPAQQMALGKNVPFATINELGARSDVRMKQISNKLEDFLTRINQIRIELFGQFYTEERYYRIRGADSKIVEGSIQQSDIQKEWVRNIDMQETIDPETNMPVMIPTEQKEKFVPEFDIKVVVVSEKPTDRNYYTNLAMQLYNMQLLTKEDLFSTLEDGKLPPMDDILERVNATQPVQQMLAQMQEMPTEVSKVVIEQMQQMIQGVMQMSERQPQQMPPQQV